ncbi:MAG: hypothetical protein KDA61_12815 [Planctomycetales bacterium]|nr:hypothetical protein [Planctomycetales bacterium]
MFTSAVLELAASRGVAQSPGDPGPQRLTQRVQPSFRIEPIVHRFKGRRGETIPFEFVLTSLGKSMHVEVEAVNLRQEENGVILHDAEGRPADAVTLTSGKQFQVAPGDEARITGYVTVPLAKSNYLSYGLLVREMGEQPDFESAPQGETRAGVRFMTQYVLRIDIETNVTTAGQAGQLILEDMELISDGGMPMVQAYLRNPTDLAFECHVAADLLHHADVEAQRRRQDGVELGMLSRATLEGEERTLIRIMPHSRLCLRGPVVQALVSGDYRLHAAVRTGRRPASEADTVAEVDARQFPGLVAMRSVLNERVAIAPSQLELGDARGAARIVPVEISNLTSEKVRVKLVPQTRDGASLASLQVRPSEVELGPWQSRKVRAMLRSDDEEQVQAAVIRAAELGVDGEVGATELLVALRRQGTELPQLEVGGLQMAGTAGEQGFEVEISNPSEAYLPLDGALSVVGRQGNLERLRVGYGRWLEPGERRVLRFAPQHLVEAGEYLLSLELATFADAPPVRRELAVTRADAESSVAASR